MVFKKPYGFLIKHFKLIHLILTGLFIYLLIKVNSVLTYYNSFILGTVGKLEAIRYVTNYYLIAVILSIVICAVMYILLKYKKKPRVLYVILIVFVLLVVFMMQLAYSGLNTIYIGVLDAKTLRLYRDLLRITVLIQYISVGLVLVRGLGFDIKKFNFVKDLEELDIDVTDEEEVELTLGSTNSLQRKINRKIREFKYYYLENKVFIHIILIVLLVVGVFSVFLNFEVINKKYQQGEVFSIDDFQFKVFDTFVTNIDYNNKMILGEDNTFVVVRMVVATSAGKKVLNTSNLVLEVNHHSYTSNGYYGNRFSDLGIAYQNQAISSGVTYLFIYQIPKEEENQKMKIVYAGDKDIYLDPIMLDVLEKEKNYNIGDKIDFLGSSLGNGYLKINKAEVNTSFSYPYQYEVDGQIYTNEYSISSARGGILHLEIDSSIQNKMDNYTFFKNYAVLKYKIGDQEYEITYMDNKTPGNYEEGLYLVVDGNVLEAQEIWFDIKVRNKHYIYTVK